MRLQLSCDAAIGSYDTPLNNLVLLLPMRVCVQGISLPNMRTFGLAIAPQVGQVGLLDLVVKISIENQRPDTDVPTSTLKIF